MLNSIIIGFIVGCVCVSITIWRCRKQLYTQDQMKRNVKSGQNKGMAIAAATIDHILENGTDLADINERLSIITSRWASYDKDNYENQQSSLESIGGL